MTTPNLRAELRNWFKTTEERDTFQGYLYNDNTHVRDGTFITLQADNVEWNKDGVLIWVGSCVYWAWNAHKKVPEKDLFDEN